MQDSQQTGADGDHVGSTRVEARLARGIERASGILTAIIALFLLVFVIVALIGVGISVWHPLFESHEFVVASLDGLDGAFLAVILLELVHTTLSRGPITQQVQQFLAIGITAGVRSGLELAARSSAAGARETIVSEALNAAAVLILVAAWWLVRQRMRADGATEFEG